MTGAFCPTISGVYQMVLTDVDDYVELWIARENPNTRSLDWTGGVIKETLNADFASRRPVRRDFAMEAYKIYPFINIWVEKTGSDQMIFNWRKPGDVSDSHSDRCIVHWVGKLPRRRAARTLSILPAAQR